MIKPQRLKKGDKVAIVSLSSGMLGDKEYLHKYNLGKKRLEEKFELEVVTMPNALKGSNYLYEHPQKRAEDFMNAFLDPGIRAIITSIGGDDTIRLLPYIDYEIIRNNPKIFTGFSDTTANHLMMFKAEIVSYYGPALMSDFAEYGAMYDYTETAIRELLFEGKDHFEIKKCPYWVNEDIPWDEENIGKSRKQIPDEKGYEIIQGSGTARGRLFGGCIDAFPMYNGTSLWPSPDQLKRNILFLETSEDYPSPEFLTYYLRNLGAQGILEQTVGIIVGKPAKEKYYEEYKHAYCKILKEFNREDIPVFYNANFGHCAPIGIIPYGIECELDTIQKKITLLESVVQ
ncbi:MAG: LD-carboxypeptidase [Tannerella sp.]|jgi:muramoyltetrapeptide carboxypeptidase LdcA involved in peptidoglycan recycling|nr:LD-carboxypeptidase [Tannerella sp.]